MIQLQDILKFNCSLGNIQHIMIKTMLIHLMAQGTKIGALDFFSLIELVILHNVLLFCATR